jgi:alpha-beta hydrolase superfamily lysophospholipase
VSGSWGRPPSRLGLRRRQAFGRDDRSLALELVSLQTVDDCAWDGLLYRPRDGEPERRRTAVLVVHGSVGNYLAGVPRWVSFGLARSGFSVLAINTRMANFGAFFGGGLLHRTPLDLDPALALLRRRGYRRVVLCGYSMGATMVTHYQALRAPQDVAGLVTLAHPLSLPGSLRRRWDRWGASPGYGEVEARARDVVGPDPDAPGEDEIVVVRRATGPTDAPADAEVWTYRTWWSCRGPEAPHAVSAERIRGVRVPVAMIQAGADELVRAGEGEQLARIALASGCPWADVSVVDGADHVFSGREAQVAQLSVAACARLIR